MGKKKSVKNHTGLRSGSRTVRDRESPVIIEKMRQAIGLHSHGQIADAAQLYREILSANPTQFEALHGLAMIEGQSGNWDSASELLMRGAQVRPHDPCVHNSLGNVFRETGHLDRALQSYDRALKIRPDYPEALSNRGSILQETGQPGAALISFQQSISLDPDDAIAHYNQAAALRDLGRLDDALTSYDNAIRIDPSFAEAHNNSGAVLYDLDRHDEALSSCNAAIRINPQYAEAMLNACMILRALGRFPEAYEYFLHSIALEESVTAEKEGYELLLHLSVAREDPQIRALMIRAMEAPWGRPADLSRKAIELVMLDDQLRARIDRANEHWPPQFQAGGIFGPDIDHATISNELLRCILENGTVVDIRLERFLVLMRADFLERAGAESAGTALSQALLAFCCALARQCFINEYIFPCSDEELRKAGNLRERIKAMLSAGEAIPALWLATVACYFPLHTLPSGHSLFERTWPEPIRSLLEQQLREPEIENHIRAELARITSVDDDVSMRVLRQYEENPYPRWLKCAPGRTPRKLADYLKDQLQYTPADLLQFGNPVQILVAGCGTGQHAIETAQSIRDAKVLAVDLSSASLAYAKRKTAEQGLINIEYAQADIMNLATIGRQFDVIESVGVLHHLADPLAGWKILVSLLKPGGLMRIGLYSEVGRQDIVAARQFIHDHHHESTAAGIRLCRQELLADPDRFASLTSTQDFFSASGCRDLLFHVQEHRFTLPELTSCIDKLGLEFCGFHLQRSIANAYRNKFPMDPMMLNLGHWTEFEENHPLTFENMYQFWVRKPS